VTKTTSTFSPPAPSIAVKPLLLTLFSYDWDQWATDRLQSSYRFETAGFDLFSFPDNRRLISFDIQAWVDGLARRFKHRGLSGVVSNHEQFGALAAALLSEKLGLPGTKPEAILRCQHKLVVRQVLDRVAPHANLRYYLLPCEYGELPPENLEYPLFVKPIKAAFSVLAKRIESREELIAHTRFGFFELWIIKRLVKPFNDVAQRRIQATHAHHMIVEQPIRAEQFNLDGYVYRGQCEMFGVVDSIMYPGTQAFKRFAYPSKLPAEVQQRAHQVAAAFLKEIEFDHGMFNMEFFYDSTLDKLTVIEFNPRLASQLADLYYRVDGRDVHAMGMVLANGDDPRSVPLRPPLGGAAASFVVRTFDGDSDLRTPTPADLDWLKANFEEAIMIHFPKSGSGLKRELKWLGSHRHAVFHLHGADEADLNRQYQRVCSRFGWPA
jgi:ATP-grasp domain